MSERPESLVAQLTGAGARLLPLLSDRRLGDVFVNGTDSVWVEKESLERVPWNFSAREVFDLVERLLVPLGKRVDAQRPFADGTLCDGTRFHVLLPPLVAGAPHVSFRKRRDPQRIGLDSFGDPAAATWLRGALAARRNILVVGATGAGKTTLLASLVDELPPGERVLLLEETREITSRHPHFVALEARPPSVEGFGEVTLRDLVRQALRMRPDRVVLGEVRGAEALDMISAMHTGHDGTLGTLHAGSARVALLRLEVLCMMAAPGLTAGAARAWVAHGLDAVVHLRREGIRRLIAEIIEIKGMEGEVVRYVPAYRLLQVS